MCGRVPQGLRPTSPSRAAPARPRPPAMIPVGSWCPRAQNLGVYASLLQCISASRAACALTSGIAVPLPALPPNQGGLAAGRPPVCRSLVSPSCPHRIPATSGAAALGSWPGTGPWCWMWCEEVVSPNTAVMGEAVGAVKNHDFGVNCPAVSRANAVSKPWHFHGSRSTFANKARGYRRVRMNSS